MILRASNLLRPRHNHHRWLMSYADLVTLLFAFFVVMFAVAQTNSVKSHDLVAVIQKKLTAQTAAINREPRLAPTSQPTADELTTAMTYLNQQLSVEINGGQMQLHLEPRGLVVSLSQAAYFPSGGNRVEPSRYPSLLKIADAVRGLQNSIRLEGHTDSQPLHRSRFEDNWDLSSARALAMLHLLRGPGQIDGARLAVAGYGETLPIAPNDTEEGRAKNRRVDIVILRSPSNGSTDVH